MHPRPLRWCVALSKQEAEIILGAAAEAGMKGAMWGRQALLRAAIRQPEQLAPPRPPTRPSQT